MAFEALAAAVGFPHKTRVTLLSDKVSSTNWAQMLTHDARVAFTTIFKDLAALCSARRRADGLDAQTIQAHLDRVGDRYTQAKSIKDKYGAYFTPEGRLSLLGFSIIAPIKETRTVEKTFFGRPYLPTVSATTCLEILSRFQVT